MMMALFLVGAFVWSLLEYTLHRWVFHERILGRRASHEHLEHHAKVNWFPPWSSKLKAAAVVLGGVGLVTVPLGGAVVGLSLVGGIVAGWLTYEALHRAIHVAGPRSAYGHWARRHHLHHHFADPRKNHGVSTPLWDVVFGTFVSVEIVRVPARQAAKLPWLLHDGHIAAGLEGTYQLPDFVVADSPSLARTA